MKTFALIVAVITLVFGLGFIVMPATIVNLYGSVLDVTGQFMARYFGSALLGLAAIFYFGTTAKGEAATLKAITLGGLVLGVAGLLVSIWDVFSGTHTRLQWLNIVLYLFFTVGFGYFYFKK